MKIAIIGAGYVGLAHAVLFSEQHDVIVVDTDKRKIEDLRNGISPLAEKEIVEFVEKKLPNVTYTDIIPKFVDYTFVAVPTNWDEENKSLDTSIVTAVLDSILSPTPIIIKSTIPYGFTDGYIERTGKVNVIFSPEFLQEGSAVEDLRSPSRLVFGGDIVVAHKVTKLYQTLSYVPKNIYCLSASAAEAVKLFSNTYLAMRVAFFNELDNFAIQQCIPSRSMIEAICDDPRIGRYYNNPSFGYGGYCLPKDVKELEQMVPLGNPLLHAISASNESRVERIVDDILSKNVMVVGIPSFEMKAGSDNVRESITVKLAERLLSKGLTVVSPSSGNEKVNIKGLLKLDFDNFVEISELIVTNRMTDNLKPYREKVYTRDIFHDL